MAHLDLRAVAKGFKWIVSMFIPLFKWAKKLILHLITRRSELERILLSGPESPELCSRFVACLQASRQLAGLKPHILGHAPFEVDKYAAAVVQAKHMSTAKASFRNRLLPNLKYCLQCINNTNQLLSAALQLRQTPYDHRQAEHEGMLERLWGALKPDVQRNGRYTSEWGDIGFQGKDPATDFRDMGLLSLHQMLHFARQRPHAARDIVEYADLPLKGFPFAITGIQLTATLLDCLTRRQLANTFPPEASGALIAYHDLYCDLYGLWNDWWHRSNPRNIMDFGIVYGRFHTALDGFVQRTGRLPQQQWVASNF